MEAAASKTINDPYKIVRKCKFTHIYTEYKELVKLKGQWTIKTSSGLDTCIILYSIDSIFKSWVSIKGKEVIQKEDGG